MNTLELEFVVREKIIIAYILSTDEKLQMVQRWKNTSMPLTWMTHI
jgi:23S rRNA maturation-related 3'-5' exoribonuclease YhaM